MIPSRVSRVLIQGDDCRQIAYNIHNQEFTRESMNTVCSAIQIDLDECSIDTLKNNLIACGDINIPSDSGRYFDYARPVPILLTDAGRDHHPRFNGTGGRLGKLFTDSRWVEVEPSAPTRYNTLHNTGSTIDRIVVNTAPSFLRQCKWTSIIVDDPKKPYTSGISDHGMVQAQACFSAAKAPGEGISPLPYLKH